jgi:RNA polymerase sigma factor (sigma-70 family)
MGIEATRQRGGMGVFDDEHGVFTAMFYRHASRVVRLAALLGAEDPEDVAQDAFCRLFEVRDRMEGDDARVVAYLNKIVVNEVRQRHRRRQVALRAPLHLVAARPHAEFTSEHAERTAMFAALAKLPERKREALVLRYWLDLPLAEVAHVMDVRVGTVKSLLSRGLDALAADLGVDR